MTNPNIGTSYLTDPLASSDLVEVSGPNGVRLVTLADLISAANGGSPPFQARNLSIGVSYKLDPLAATDTIMVHGGRGRRPVTLADAVTAGGGTGNGSTRTNPNVGTSYATNAISSADTVMVMGANGRRPATLAEIVSVAATLLPTSRPDVFILNDFRAAFGYNDGGTDMDNAMILPPMVLGTDQYNIVGLGCTMPTANTSAKTLLQSWLTTTYAADYPNYVSKRPAAQSPTALSALVYQGALAAAGASGFSTATECSTAIVTAALNGTYSPTNKLNIVVGGTYTDLAQALHDSPSIIPNIRVIGVAFISGFYNFDQDANAANYILGKLVPGQAFQDLEFIAINHTLYGEYENGSPDNRDREFPLVYASGHGSLIGDFLMDCCIDTFQPGQNWHGWNGGDYIGLLYVMDIAAGRRAPGDPTANGWAGFYQKDATKGNNYYSDVQTGYTMNSHPGAATVNAWRNAYKADLAAKFDDCCVTAPIIKGYDDLEDITVTIADANGRTIKGATGATWKNQRPANAFPISIVYQTPSAAYITDSGTTSFLAYMDGVVGDASGNIEAMMIAYTDDLSASGSGGLGLAYSGDTTTGTHVKGFPSSNTNFNLQKFVNGTATDNIVTIASTFALTMQRRYFQRFRCQNNGDGTFTYTWHMKYGFGTWTLVKQFTDSTSPIDAVGKFPGINGRQNTRIYGIVARVPGA